MTYDLIIRNGAVVLENAVRTTTEGSAHGKEVQQNISQGEIQQTDIAIEDERIVAIAPELEGAAQAEIDASGLHIFPGVIDAHVHLNDPGRSEWEGFYTGSFAMAAGGTTCCFDMPLNAHPPTVDAASFEFKRAAAQGNTLIDFALWGGMIPGNLEQMDELAACGIVGFKAFMSNSGISDFPAVDDSALYEGMACAAQLNKIVALHAENDQLTAGLARRALAYGRRGIRDYCASRPVLAEVEAIQRALLFARATGCALHIVHVSSGSGVAMIAEARASGQDVTCETCPHYLVFSEEDMERLGAIAKCAPPLRSEEEQKALWAHLLKGEIDLIASDHSPAPPEMKESANFFQVWGGISGCQSLLTLLLSEGYSKHAMPLTQIAHLTSASVARRFSLPTHKGRLAPGCDADLTFVDLKQSHELRTEDLYYRHQHSPYVGMQMHGKVVRTLLRGKTIFREGNFTDLPSGRLIRAVD
jgi:allantoinase